MMSDEKFARDLHILALHRAGVSLQAIGKQYGVTRERVRQIVARLGGTPKRETIRQRDASVLNAILARNLTAEEAAREFNLKAGVVYKIGHEAGHIFRRDTRANGQDVAEAVRRVEGGASIRQACGGDNYLAGLVAARCRELGIRTKHGRHRDFLPRYKIVVEMRSAGCPWEQVAQVVGAVEGASMSVKSLWVWANNRGLTGRGTHAAAHKSPRASKSCAPSHERATTLTEVIVAHDAKTAALLNYGKCTASAVARAHGVSRNSIIGHWFRLRKAGLLPNSNGAAA